MKNFLKNLYLRGHYNTDKMLKLRSSIENGGGGIPRLIRQFRYQRYCSHFGCYIPSHTEIGGGITFPHGPYGVFISQGAVIGKNCTIFQQVTIGSNTLSDSKGAGAPSIGDHVYIGAGAKIIGSVHVGDFVRIGANAIVVKDVPDNATVVMPESVIIAHNEQRNNHFVKFSS